MVKRVFNTLLVFLMISYFLTGNGFSSPLEDMGKIFSEHLSPTSFCTPIAIVEQKGRGFYCFKG